jgi:nicotinamide-nucleotide amidase
MLTDVPGSSSYFLGGVISYDNSVKISLLGVKPEDLAQLGAVSATVAEQMAAGVQMRLSTTWGLSITGIAGPDGGTAAKPVGLVYIGLVGPKGEVQSFEHRLGEARGRSLIRHVSACTALDYLRRKLLSRKLISNRSSI